MADDFIKGLDALREELKSLPGNIEKNAMRKGITDAAKMMKEAVSAAAPVSSGMPPKGGRFGPSGGASSAPPGTLKRHMKHKRRRGSKGEVAAGVFGVWYAKLVEKGHLLKAHDKKTVIGHVAPNPYIANAFEANKERVVETMKEGIVASIQKQVAKLRAKMPRGG